MVNTGNVRLLLDGERPRAPPPPVVADDAPGVLPGDRRSVSVQLDGIWPLFGVGAGQTITPTPSPPTATAPITVTAVPVPQLLGLVVAALIQQVREPRTVETAPYSWLPRRAGVPSVRGDAPE
ncbi:hypothetical protein [Rathayibacter rathayi]|uniref:hypothetical protein n=1 Tax=Rathayibacter rathayi TaxID=33887 RepID=UPI0011B013A2|nr:hypothetical protein [Rathayibacter rathayi]